MKAVEIIMIPVTDQQKAKEFYLQLGLNVVAEAPDAHGGTWLQMGFPGSGTTIALAKFQGIIFETENIEKQIKEYAAKGIAVGKVDNTPWGKFAWLKDADGNSLCLHER